MQRVHGPQEQLGHDFSKPKCSYEHASKHKYCWLRTCINLDTAEGFVSRTCVQNSHSQSYKIRKNS